jgi:ferredoxin-NADP reductase
VKQHYFWKTTCIIRETTQSVTVIFDTQGDVFSFKAGQFVNLTLSINGESVTRSYSLSSAPEHDAHPAITVKAVEAGIMSNYILNHAEEIQEWEIDGPHGFFHVTAETENCKWVVLIGGGSGITPLYSILKQLLLTSFTNILLVDSNKYEANVIFANALAYMQQVFSDRLKIVQVFTGSAETHTPRWSEIIQGRLSRIRLKKIIRQHLGDEYLNAQYFVCGPDGLLQHATEVISGLEVPQHQFHQEYFQAKAKEINVSLPQEMQEVLIHHMERSNLLEVEPGKTILETALQDHVQVPYSCKKGTCGICVAKLVEGDVYMRQNYVLPNDRVNEGYILLCQSHPLNNNVTVETTDFV